ncbi:MAG: vitamin K epoxide reductase family protein [bacterium]
MSKNKLSTYSKLKAFFKTLTPNVVFPIVLVVFGLVGAVASVTINVEKTSLLKHPQQSLSCDLNPVYSCARIIDTKQSTVLGVSNELLGIAMFSVLLTTGVVLLAGAKLKPWYWRLFLAGMIGFMLFVGWLFYQSVYSIGFLCILCSTAWFSGWAITTAGYAWMYDNKLIVVNKRYINALKFVRRNILVIWVSLILIFAFLVLNHFWYYYRIYFDFLGL